mmetsp:Transcript_15404/g.27289  ORF Transcript_15404/g.27289 Transcript_15404/m.27289 type:complete len:287 (-) Transcript_15404:676-1536(-)
MSTFRSTCRPHSGPAPQRLRCGWTTRRDWFGCGPGRGQILLRRLLLGPLQPNQAPAELLPLRHPSARPPTTLELVGGVHSQRLRRALLRDPALHSPAIHRDCGPNRVQVSPAPCTVHPPRGPCCRHPPAAYPRAPRRWPPVNRFGPCSGAAPLGSFSATCSASWRGWATTCRRSSGPGGWSPRQAAVARKRHTLSPGSCTTPWSSSTRNPRTCGGRTASRATPLGLRRWYPLAQDRLSRRLHRCPQALHLYPNWGGMSCIATRPTPQSRHCLSRLAVCLPHTPAFL